MNKYFLGLSLLFPAIALAMFCPKNFNAIEIGNTQSQVEAQCGKPDSIKKYKDEPDKNLQPQEWSYYIKAGLPNSTATLRTTVAFKDGKVINLTVNNTSVPNSQICGTGKTIQMGDSIDTVKAMCGEPVTISRDNGNETATAATSATPPPDTFEWTYNTTPPVTLVFKKDKLVERK